MRGMLKLRRGLKSRKSAYVDPLSSYCIMMWRLIRGSPLSSMIFAKSMKKEVTFDNHCCVHRVCSVTCHE